MKHSGGRAVSLIKAGNVADPAGLEWAEMETVSVCVQDI